MKYFTVILTANDEATEKDIKNVLSHFDGKTAYETGEDNRIIFPGVDKVLDGIILNTFVRKM